jgi:hypothetical protein
MCRRAQQTDGNITIASRVFQGNVGTTTSHSFFLAGGLDSGHHCSRDTLHLGNSGKHDYQSAQTVIELTLTKEYAKINELTGKIRLPGDLVARAADKSIRDLFMGTMVWQFKATTCPQGLTQLFRGMMDGAEEEAKSAKEVPAVLSNYPSLTEVRQNERYNFWRSLCKREAGAEDEVAASVPERGQEGEWQPINTEANGLPKFF